ncbi:MAG: geranylgeranylglycerol-phosphate geranylgeranyltransferase, partial [Bacteroidia bacterium]|nr:geranylgeranylglycerol-phosphate geranylgeranyltransferase [Bacteroidia bacterium]
MGTNRNTAIKVLALLSTVRWYNILLTVAAQYLGAYFLARHTQHPFESLVLNVKLHLIVISTVFTIAAGFIINNFYDYEKDMINRPKTTLFNRLISKKTILNLYISFNLISLTLAAFASFRILLFFLGFVSLLWIYSHKLKSIPFVKEFSASILSVASFFSIGLHYGQWYNFVFAYGVFFLSLVFTREIIKDFENRKGDTAVGNTTLLLYLGEEKTKAFVYLLMCFSVFIGISFMVLYHIKPWTLYVLGAVIFVAFNLVFFRKSVSSRQYAIVNAIYKLMLVAGVLNI